MIDTYGFKDLNFSRGKDNKYFKKQRMIRGFDDSELWNLDITISQFILPRLMIFRKNHHGYPADLTNNQWNTVLEKMIRAFEWDTHESNIYMKVPDYVNEGLDLFRKYFFDLWD